MRVRISCKRKKIILENWTKHLLLYVAFIVRRAHGLLPPPKILKGLKDLRHNSIFRRKRASAMGAGQKRGCRIARNARCSPVQLNETLTFAANVKSTHAMTWNNFNLLCLIESSCGSILNESRQMVLNNGSRKWGRTMPAHNARPSIPPTTWNVESAARSRAAIM